MSAADLTPVLDELAAIWFPADLESADELGARAAVWFGGPGPLDERLRDGFAALPDRVAAAIPGIVQLDPVHAVAAIISLDQVPRNIHRGSARSFQYDAAAVALAEALVAAGVDRAVHPIQACFVYLPFEHAEDAKLQERSVDSFTALAERAPESMRASFQSFIDFAERHQRIIERFGRFPHRNDVLGRRSTREEVAYLDGGGDTFQSSRGTA